MYLNIGIVYSIIFFVIGLVLEKKKLNPLTIFYGEWLLILYLSKMHLYNINSVSDNAYMLILIGLVFFSIGYFLARVIPKKHFFNKAKITYSINKKAIILLSASSFIFFFFDFAKSMGYLLRGQSLGFLRMQAQEGSLFGNPVQNALRIIITAPFSTVLTVLAPVTFFLSNDKRYKKTLLIWTVLILGERLLSDGGRSPFVYLILAMLVSYSFSKKKKKTLKKVKKGLVVRVTKRFKYISLFVVLGAILLFYVTLSRSGADSRRITYFYFAMEPVMLDKWCKLVDSSGLYAFGMASFNGFLFVFFYIIVNTFGSILGFTYPKYWRSIYEMIESLGTNWQIITNGGLQANSYASIFWTFYFDARILGIILGMFIYSFFACYWYRRTISDSCERNVAIYSLVFIGLFYSFQQFIFQNIYYSISFLMLISFAYKKSTDEAMI